MAKKEPQRIRDAVLTSCMITQDLNIEHWDWTADELLILQSEDAGAIAQVVKEQLERIGCEVIAVYAIIHDKDVHEDWDESTMQTVVVPKLTHIHIIVRFGEKRGATLPDIALAVGLEPQYVEKPKAGRFGYDNMMAYLTHIKYTEKYQYEPDDVVTVCGLPYTEIYADRKDAWIKGRAKVKANQAKEDIDWLEETILLGQITFNEVMLTDGYYNIYARNKRRCDDAFDTYAQRKICKTIRAMENGEFKLSVFYITGKSGSGKSVFTDHFVTNLKQNALEKFGEEWTVCSVASSNPFDEYRGEEIMVMDDLRGMALSASDWLKLLDPDRINTGSARYKNKKIATRVIVINSEKDVLDFFYFLKNGGGDRSEAMDQFFRRIIARVEVVRYEDENRVVNIGMSRRTDSYRLEAPDNSASALTLNYDFTADQLNEMNYEDALAFLTNVVTARNGLNVSPDCDKRIEELLQEFEDKRSHMGKALIEDIKETIRQEDEAREEQLRQMAEEEHRQLELEFTGHKELKPKDNRPAYQAEDRQYH